MANLTAVTITNGQGSAGSGTVSTIDNIPNLWDKGPGQGGSLTQRVMIDSSQVAAFQTADLAKASGYQLVGLATDQAPLAIFVDVSKVGNGSGVTVPPLHSTVVASALGATTIVAAVASKKIRVLAYAFTASAAVNVKWQSHVTPTDLSGLTYCAAAGDGAVLGWNPGGWFDTLVGEALDINLSAAVAVGGHLTYVTI